MARAGGASAVLMAVLLFISAINCDAFSRRISRREISLPKREKLTHLHFFFHDIVSGPTPTAYEVAKGPITDSSPTGFGSVSVMDDPLTVEPDVRSRIVGRAQGVYVSADSNQLALLMALNFVFTEGEFNGSSLAVMGRNAVMSDVKELPILGGSGAFRFARGYAEARMHQINMTTGDAIVDYNVYVFHY